SLGGIVRAGYTPSSTWSNTYLPVVFPTVNTLITDDGRAQPTSVATTTYQYSGGFWHVMERRFRGFRTQIATLPCATTPCPTVTTNYLRSAAHVSAKIEMVDEKDGAGTVLRHRLEEYTLNSTTVPYTSFNTASWRYVYDGAANKRTKVTRSFDGFGNITQSTNHGDFDVSGDEVTTATDFAFNSGPYI